MVEGNWEGLYAITREFWWFATLSTTTWFYSTKMRMSPPRCFRLFRSLKHFPARKDLDSVVKILPCLFRYDFIWRIRLTVRETVILLTHCSWTSFTIEFDVFNSIDILSPTKKQDVVFCHWKEYEAFSEQPDFSSSWHVLLLQLSTGHICRCGILGHLHFYGLNFIYFVQTEIIKLIKVTVQVDNI